MLSKTGRLVKKEAPDDLSWKLFFAGAFINAIPGIILHIVLIPIVLLFRQEKISEVIMKKSTLECLGEAEVDPEEINDLVQERNPYTLRYFGLSFLQNITEETAMNIYELNLRLNELRHPILADG